MKPATYTAAKPHKPLPKFWRPKTALSAQLTCKIIHWDLITHFTRGTAGAEELWDWIETGFTYSQMMRLLMLDGMEFSDADKLALNAQIEIYDAVIARFKATGRPGFNGAELAIARAAAAVMDHLITQDRHGIADRAARWSLEQIRSLRSTGKSARISL